MPCSMVVQVIVSLAAQLTMRDTLLVLEVSAMFAHYSLCEGSVTTMLNGLHYGLPSAREGSHSCLVGGPLAQQVQHTVYWTASLVLVNALQDLVLHSQECAKVPPSCIQSVI